MEDYEVRVPQPGERYEHYRGGLFEVLLVGRLSEARDQIMVVYKSLDRGHTWIRPLGMWSEYVEWDELVVPDYVSTEKPPTFYKRHRAQRFKLVP